MHSTKWIAGYALAYGAFILVNVPIYHEQRVTICGLYLFRGTYLKEMLSIEL